MTICPLSLSIGESSTLSCASPCLAPVGDLTTIHCLLHRSIGEYSMLFHTSHLISCSRTINKKIKNKKGDKKKEERTKERRKLIIVAEKENIRKLITVAEKENVRKLIIVVEKEKRGYQGQKTTKNNNKKHPPSHYRAAPPPPPGCQSGKKSPDRSKD